LFPLERSFFFVHKPPTHIRFEDISSVDFLRVNTDSTNRTFDFGINLNNGNVVMFKSILREEYSALFQFITSKQLTILNFKDLRPSSESEDVPKGYKRSQRGSVVDTRSRVRRAMQQEEILEDESDEDFGDGDGDLRTSINPSPIDAAEDDVELDSAEIDSASDLEDFAVKKPEGDADVEEITPGGKEEEDRIVEEDTEKNSDSNLTDKDGDKNSKKRKRETEAESPPNIKSAPFTTNNSTTTSSNTTSADKGRPPKRIKVDQESQQGTAVQPNTTSQEK